MIDAEFVKAVTHYANCLINLLIECDNEDFVDNVVNCVCAADKDGLGDLQAFVEDE